MVSNNSRQHMIGRATKKILQGSRGAALIPIIIAIVVIAGIGALLLSLSTVGTFNPILGNSADRAYYLAESGFRYAAMTYQHGGADQLDAINNQTYPIDTNQTFTLRFRTYKLEADGGGNASTLTALPAFGLVPQVPEGSVSGYLKVGNRNAREFSSVNINADETEISITRSSGNWNVSNRDPIRFAARNEPGSSSSVTEEGGSLQIQSDTRALEFFPKYNGQFTIDGMVYRYRIRDADTNRLLGVTRVDGDWEDIDLNPNEAIVLNDFVVIHATGRYGQGFFGATRKLTYNVPFSTASGGYSFQDYFDNENLDNWNTQGDIGSHEVREVREDNALAVDGIATQGNDRGESLIAFDRGSGADFKSYDAQVKIRTENEPVFMDGISFRLHGNNRCYGLSFLKAAENNSDGIPDNLVPTTSPTPGQPMVVLWERASPGQGNLRWLAYHALPADSHIGSNMFFEDDMENGGEQWDTNGNQWTLQNSEDPLPQGGTQFWQSEYFSFFQFYRELTLDADSSFDLSETSNVEISFWHLYDIPQPNTIARVQIETDSTDWTTVASYNGIQSAWTKETIDISDYAGASNVRIRFILVRWDAFEYQQNWLIDNIKVYEPGLNWPTLMLSTREAESLSFSGGSIEINSGDTVSQADASGDVTASATVFTDPILVSEDWSNDDAAGDLLLSNVWGNFSDGEDLMVNGQTCATVNSINGLQNYIRAYIGDQQEHGVPGNPLDRERLANPRGIVNWPPREIDATNSSNDYLTLVQWNSDTNATVTRLGAGEEQNAVIRTDRFTTDDLPADRPELGLHTWGWGSADGEPDRNTPPSIYFDDFAVRTEPESVSSGFYPALQQSHAGE